MEFLGIGAEPVMKLGIAQKTVDRIEEFLHPRHLTGERRIEPEGGGGVSRSRSRVADYRRHA